jgi:phospholipid/cholesterol/gamma-HCH transport system substrate-binding protein
VKRRPSQSIVANPVLVGAVTTLVVIVAVFLAYNANNGLPFVPSRKVNVLFTNGAQLVKGNEVREGGFRVGVVTEMVPVRLRNGVVGAQVQLKLDRKVGALPVDSTFKIRPRSALGLKYVEVVKGRAKKTYAEGATVPVGHSEVPVDLDQVFSMFDEPTRRASQENLQGFGDTFAARGQSLNVTIQTLNPLLGHLAPVMRNLADPGTELRRFFKELGDAARVVAPVADVQARLFTTMADTFEAISNDPQALKDTIAKSPDTLAVSTDSLRAQRPFLADTAAWSRDLVPATAELRRALPTVNDALEIGTPVLRRSVQLNRDLQGAMNALRDLATDPGTNAALFGLNQTVGTLNPQLRFLGPYVTVCNYWNMWWTFIAEHFSEADPTGSAQRALLNTSGDQRNGVNRIGAYEPANGEEPGPTTTIPQHLHGQPYGAAVDSNGNADCETGQRGYLKKLNSLGVRGVDPGDGELNIVTDPHTPGNQGPTYKKWINGQPQGLNTDHVPPGQTFSREPEIGPKLDPRLLQP